MRILKKPLKLYLFICICLSYALGYSLNAQAAVVGDMNIKNWQPRTIHDIQEQLPSDTYTIQWGDTLEMICRAAELPLDHIIAWNQIAHPDLIYPQDTLFLKDPNTFDSSAHGDPAAHFSKETAPSGTKSSAVNRFEQRQ